MPIFHKNIGIIVIGDVSTSFITDICRILPVILAQNGKSELLKLVNSLKQRITVPENNELNRYHL